MTGDPDGRLLELTPVQQRRIQSSLAIDESPAQRIAYQHAVLCQTCLPYRNPGDSMRVWKRRQGAVVLKVTAGEARDPLPATICQVGLPFGSRPRLILAHLNREALVNGLARASRSSTA